MYEEKLNILLEKVKGSDFEAMWECRNRWDSIAKPIDGLGELEQMVIKIAGIAGTANLEIKKKAVVVMCADNGVVAQGVTQSDSSVTTIVAENLAKGRSSINVMAEVADATVIPVDMGMKKKARGDIWDYSVADGTQDITMGPAMSCEQAAQAILAGIDIVKKLTSMGYKIIATGEMGIGNTTTTAAVTSAILGVDPDLLTGRGAGLSDENFQKKREVVKKAINVNRTDPNDPLKLLATLGGFDIAGMTGLYLGGAIYRVPVIIDGAISAVAALVASRLCDAAGNFMLSSHMGKDPAMPYLMDALGEKPVIRAELALGEGTGAVMLLPMIDMALGVYGRAHGFKEIKLKPYERYEK